MPGLQNKLARLDLFWGPVHQGTAWEVLPPTLLPEGGLMVPLCSHSQKAQGRPFSEDSARCFGRQLMGEQGAQDMETSIPSPRRPLLPAFQQTGSWQTPHEDLSHFYYNDPSTCTNITRCTNTCLELLYKQEARMDFDFIFYYILSISSFF